MDEKRTIYLVCNSHIDPVWQWNWDEGFAAGLSTFYAAAELLKKNDFVFCHNEAILYEYVEKRDPELFKTIQGLVKEGKWRIIGGWYIQPDCLVPSGESFLRQCTLGIEYFVEKFGVRPTCALNFDSFGHTKGLPQILKKCGFESYTFCRPMPFHHVFTKEDMPHGPFLWKGYDGSIVKALRYEDETIYCSTWGQARKEVERKINHYPDQQNVCILWGVGNHGGVSSAQDIADLAALKEEKKDEFNIIHSDLSEYFASVNPTTVYDQEIITYYKSYSSVNGMKQAHDRLENALYRTEKLCSLASLEADHPYDHDTLKKAEKALAAIEFHDTLSGTAIKTGTDATIRKAEHAIEELDSAFNGAFVSLASHLAPAPVRRDAIVAWNPNPYEYDGLVENEIFLENGLFSDVEMYRFTVRDSKGNVVPHQIIKEESEINIDRSKRILIKTKLPAYGFETFNIEHEKAPLTKFNPKEEGDIHFKDSVKEIVINRETGLLDSFRLHGVEMVGKGSFQPMMFQDNEDPWGWWKNHYGDAKPIRLDRSGKGVFQGLNSVTILEDGKLMTEIQCLFSKGESHLIFRYRLYKDLPYIDLNIHVLWQEQTKGLKLRVNALNGGKYFDQMAFGIEEHSADGLEYPSNRYVGYKGEENAFVIYNRSGIHSASKKGKALCLTLLNGSAYCAHPADARPIIVDPRRYIPFIEQGAHDFSLRIGVNPLEECERVASEFNQPVYSVSFYPHGKGDETKEAVELSNPNIVISAFKQRKDGTYLIRLYNGSKGKAATNLRIQKASIAVTLGKFAFRTFVYDGKTIVESKDAALY